MRVRNNGKEPSSVICIIIPKFRRSVEDSALLGVKLF